MKELEFNKSFINFTEGYDIAPFELIIGDKYDGNQQLTYQEAKSIADFIYENLPK